MTQPRRSTDTKAFDASRPFVEQLEPAADCLSGGHENKAFEFPRTGVRVGVRPSRHPVCVSSFVRSLCTWYPHSFWAGIDAAGRMDVSAWDASQLDMGVWEPTAAFEVVIESPEQLQLADALLAGPYIVTDDGIVASSVPADQVGTLLARIAKDEARRERSAQAQEQEQEQEQAQAQAQAQAQSVAVCYGCDEVAGRPVEFDDWIFVGTRTA
jgi:hypothetical protein